MASGVVPRSFLKWAGGKARLLEDLCLGLPAQFGGYHEPFVGSGALFFRLVRDGKIRFSRLSDANQELIDTYCAIRDCADEVVSILATYPYQTEFYYALRAADPASLDLPERAARMIYLNKTGYNGLYRVNRAGKFNVPFGRHKSPHYCDPENLVAVADALQGTILECAPFESVVDRARPGDLVYFDPPYAPLSPTANFTSYHAHGFSPADQERLRDVSRYLARSGVHVMISNSDTPLIRELYAGDGFRLHQVWANRAINSNGARRGKLSELVITHHDCSLSHRPRVIAGIP